MNTNQVLWWWMWVLWCCTWFLWSATSNLSRAHSLIDIPEESSLNLFYKTRHIHMHNDLSLIIQWSKAENVHLEFLDKQSSRVCRASLLNAGKLSETLNETLRFHLVHLFSHACISSVFRWVFTHLLLSTSVLHSDASVFMTLRSTSVESQLICFAGFHGSTC